MTLRHKFWIVSSVFLMCVPGLCAGQDQQTQQPQQTQDQPRPQDQSQQPIPAYHPPAGYSSENASTSPDSDNVAPDNRPPAGAQSLSLGIPESHSYWDPSVHVSATATSNGLGASGGWTTYTTVVGGLDLHRVGGRSNFALNYLGGGVFSNDGGFSDEAVDELSVSERVSWRRATLSLLDQASYLPQSGFGYAGLGALGLPGGGTFQLQPGLTPGGTVLTTRVRQLDDSSLAELDTVLSPRSSVSLLGGYSLLHFFGSDLLDTNDVFFQGGYNRDVTRKDTIAVLYRFSAFRYGGSSQSLNDNTAQLSYARRVTGRLAFQVSAGPEFTLFGEPILAGSGAGSSGGTASSQWNWSLSSSLTYGLRRSELGLIYTHGVGGGAGVFAGSLADTVTASLSRSLSRTFQGNLSAGFARNRVLAVPGFSNPTQAYRNWFGNADLSHPWGRNLNLDLSYRVQYQDSNSSFCVGPTCGESFVVHSISVNLGWQNGPVGF